MRRTFEVWFYIGSVLSLYGAMLTLAGLYQWVHPPPTVLATYHATLWAGVLLELVGVLYLLVYWPKKASDNLRTPAE